MRHIVQHFGQHATEAHHDVRAEVRIIHRTGDHLDAGGHLLHRDAVDARVGRVPASASRHGLCGGLECFKRIHVKAHGIGLGLVRDVGGGELHRYRERHRAVFERENGIERKQHFLGRRNAVAREALFRHVFRQCARAFEFQWLWCERPRFALVAV